MSDLDLGGHLVVVVLVDRLKTVTCHLQLDALLSVVLAEVVDREWLLDFCQPVLVGIGDSFFKRQQRVLLQKRL